MKKSTLALTLLLCTTSIILTAAGKLHAADHKKADLSHGAVLFTFDDLFVPQWLEAAKTFKEFDAHATFFIFRPHLISKKDYQGLTRLQKEGHTIGCHSMYHHRAVNFVKTNGIKKYMQTEITPAMKALKAAGFVPTSFAYPCSQRNAETDEALLKIFRHLRTGMEVPKEKRIKDVDAIFTPIDQIAKTGCLCGAGIDYTDTERRPADFFEQICEALDRAKTRGEVVVFYAHNISEKGPSHHLRPEALRKILAYAQKIGLPAIGYDELP